MKIRPALILASLVLLGAPVAAFACEPIVPFIRALGAPRVVLVSFVVLGVVVLLKSAAFARFQNKISFSKALFWMLAANVFTSIIGLMVPTMVESGGAAFIAVPLIWAICLLPARRLIAAFPLSPLSRYSPGQVALAITATLVVSYLLLLMSRLVRDSASFALFWIVKLPAAYIALLIGLALTAFWEEWIVWRFSGSEEEDLTFVRPVIRANLVVLAAVVVISFGVIIPNRFRGTAVVAAERPQTVQQPSPSPAP